MYEIEREVPDWQRGWEFRCAPIWRCYQTAYHDIQVLQPLINVTLATATGGGPCTQVLLNAGSCVGTSNDNITFNANKARIYGVEWDVTALPADWLTLNASGSYIDPRYTDFTVPVPAGYLAPTNSLNLDGTPIPVPAWQTNETATVDFGTDLAGRCRLAMLSRRITTGRAAIWRTCATTIRHSAPSPMGC